MPSIINSSPISEQSICIKCGLCCDGTLFDNAVLNPGEKGNLPEKMEHNYVKSGEKEYFKLPCLYFNEKCTIYDQKKAHVCSAFRCQLLKNLSKGKINKKNAEDIVINAFELRNEIFQNYKTINKTNVTPSFRALLFEVRKKNEANIKDKEFNLLLFKCNIFEILLIKYFKSSKEFESLLME